MDTSPIEYDFDERLKMSQGISESKSIVDILMMNIPGACKVIKAHGDNDRSGTDWWVELSSGQFLSIDCKIRSEDWSVKQPPRDDLALETWSVIERKIVGWTRDVKKRTDYIMWFWKDTGRWCLIPFRMLCKVFASQWQQWRKEFKTARQKTPRANYSYHSECIFVPRRKVWAEIYKVYGGQNNP